MSAPGELIAGRYRVVRRVGAGGMGVVWEGWDERLQRTVAIKQLHPQRGLSEPDAKIASERAMREARITARLHHQYAVSVFDVVEHEGQPCLVMQFLPSQPLSAVLRERGTLSPDEVAAMGAQLSAALAAAHRVGIVHRDIKPGNVLISDDGTARISDFGISHALGDVTLTVTGMVTGTPAYLAPEVARGGQASFASDVFSLGATLYTATEGTPPFGTGENSMALLHRVALGEVVRPSRSGPLTPLLERMLTADPDARPSMSDIARDLSQHGPGAGSTATAVMTPIRTDPSNVPWPPAPRADQRREPEEPAVAATGTAAFTSAQQPDVTAGDDGTGERGREPVSPPLMAAQPPTATPTSAAAGRGGGGRRLALAAAAIAALIGTVVLAMAFLPGQVPTSQSPADTSAASPSEAATTESSEPAPSTQEPSSPAPSRTSASAAPTPRTSPTSRKPPKPAEPAGGKATAKELAEAITSYYDLMPGNIDEAWPRMTPSYQQTHAGGRAAYEAFWDPVERVSVSKVKGTPPNQAVATVTYVYEDGRVVQERTSYELVNEGGIWKISDSAVLGNAG
ncbi:MAG TPA: protein kinase [Propionibacteriaceae bacterium]|nr:protein kinase [Propionibacteriaceae bacterium]